MMYDVYESHSGSVTGVSQARVKLLCRGTQVVRGQLVTMLCIIDDADVGCHMVQ